MSNVHGLSLEPLLRGELVTARPAYLETRLPLENYGWFELRGLRTEAMKLVSGAGNELYDLETDPKELRDLHELRPEQVARLARSLKRAIEHAASGKVDPSMRPIGDAEIERIESLGYVGDR